MGPLCKEDMSAQLAMFPSSPGRRGSFKLSTWSPEIRTQNKKRSRRFSLFASVVDDSSEIEDKLRKDSVVYATKRTSATDPHGLPHLSRLSTSHASQGGRDASHRLSGEGGGEGHGGQGHGGQGHGGQGQGQGSLKAGVSGLPGRRLDQKQITLLRLDDWQKYNWTLPPLPACRLAETTTDLITMLRTRRLARQKLRDAFKRPTQVSSELSGDDLLRGGEGTDGRKLPPVPRSALGQPMLRRPAFITDQEHRTQPSQQPATTTKSSSSSLTTTAAAAAAPSTTSSSDELMKMLGNYLDLKPVTDVSLMQNAANKNDPLFAGGSAEFYNTHYPLLLRKKNFHDEDEKTASETKVVTARQIQTRLTSEQKRRADLERRVLSLERSLTSLERGEGDMEEGEYIGQEAFVTELRHTTFDPRTWPWNAERYQGKERTL